MSYVTCHVNCPLKIVSFSILNICNSFHIQRKSHVVLYSYTFGFYGDEGIQIWGRRYTNVLIVITFPNKYVCVSLFQHRAKPTWLTASGMSNCTHA